MIAWASLCLAVLPIPMHRLASVGCKSRSDSASQKRLNYSVALPE